MSRIWQLFQWLLKAAVFFTLFAFALNNQQDATVHFFFGQQWRLPMVLVVLIAFTLGLVVGVAGMLPLMWRKQRATDARASEQAGVSDTTVQFNEHAPLETRQHGI